MPKPKRPQKRKAAAPDLSYLTGAGTINQNAQRQFEKLKRQQTGQKPKPKRTGKRGSY
jgi:hypothetical protein